MSKRGRARSLAALRAYNRTATRTMRARAARKGWKGHKARARSAAAVKAARTRKLNRARAAAPVMFEGAPVAVGGGGAGGAVEGARIDEAREIFDEEFFEVDYGFEGEAEAYGDAEA